MSKVRFPIVALGLVLLCVLSYGLGWAQEASEGTKRVTALIYITGGGWIGYIILTCSVVALAFIIEFFVTLQRDRLIPPQLVGELEALLDERQYEEALNLCEAERVPISNVIGAAIAKVESGYEAMVNALQEVGEEEAYKLSMKISWLSLLGNITPMLGLFGTVYGMIVAFQKIAAKGNPTPADLAEGVYMALVTTFQGLVVAIPVLAFYAYFKNKVTRLVLEMGAISGELVERFRPAAK